jgi:precorrin-6A/cobalt-precorrin-6A reductase
VRQLLILGGTGEAAALAHAALDRFGDRLHVTSSLAGRTADPAPISGDVRIGGFGGAGGLERYLREHEIDFVVDATHPFAEQISHHARLACDAASVPRLQLVRPAWERHPLDQWIEVDDLAEAARLVRKLGRRAFLTVGANELDAFADIHEVHFLVRLVAEPRQKPPLRFYELILGRGPFSLAEERHLLQRHAIDVIVAKASGGAATVAKLIAAREASLPVLMLRRPPQEPGEAVSSVEAAIAWLASAVSKAA